ncbi:MAG TPA: YicC family protein [Bacteroidia bacterium]|nr:YicC family protein [Bacteroidia bacterium]
MIKSMTGFGKAQRESGDKIINVEIRSLNSKSADISLRVSSSLRNYEAELRNELIRQLERGKIDLGIYLESKKTETPGEVNLELAKAYHDQLRNLALELNEPLRDSISLILKMPDILKTERKESGEEEFKLVKAALQDAIQQLRQFREKEGEALHADLEQRLSNIEAALSEITKLDSKRLDNLKNRLRTNLEETIGRSNIDQNRFEQELIYYLEKLDINEEKVRLKTHLNYFRETSAENSPGRKLGFISQEIGREINTIGSKANDASIQKLVVMMKDELEKLKEQLNNVL